jgi:hypothetical protein
MYYVELEFPRDEHASLPANPGPIEVDVRLDGDPAGKPHRSASYGGYQTAGFYEFWAEAGDRVTLAVRPTRHWRTLQDRTVTLNVRRVPFDYAMYFIKQFGLWLLATLLAGVGLACVLRAAKQARG